MFSAIDKINTQYSGIQRFILMILFPLFEVKDISYFTQSPVYQLYKCGKDVFYRFINNPEINWRKISFSVTKQLIKRVEKQSETTENEQIKCIIVDDTDLPKRGRCFELVSRIYSHVTHRHNLGFKGLFLGYHDGKSFFGLDFSLHGEKGKKGDYGLSKKETKNRFSKKRDENSFGKVRENEYFKSKIEMMISMLKSAISQGIRFDYLLVDSWFTCFEIVNFIKKRKIKCHFLGMLKNGNTKYHINGKDLTVKEILHNLKHSKKMSYSKKLHCWFYEQTVDFKGIKVKLFFCRTTKRGKWNCLLTTNCELKFEKAYEIYATRWCIEVFFKECKQLLRLGKCESQDFDAQIAATTLCMLQFNLLSAVKRLENYESLGALFRHTKSETLEQTVKERIWLIITQIVAKIEKYFNFDSDFIIENIIADNEELTNILNFKTLLQAA
ncbi:IS4 family transposase ISDha5 [Bacteroidia bacterium]|nr:IS4 family transposase ISDha5 [Bacteroidia bacterium]